MLNAFAVGNGKAFKPSIFVSKFQLLTTPFCQGCDHNIPRYLDLRLWTLASLEDQEDRRHLSLEAANRAGHCIQSSGFTNVAHLH